MKKLPPYKHKSEIAGYFAVRDDGKKIIMLPSYCANCDNKDKPLEKVKQFEEFVIKKLEFYND